MDDYNRRKRGGGRNNNNRRSNNRRDNNYNEISGGINPTNALYIGSAVIAGAVLLYSGLKLFLNNKENQSESKTESKSEDKNELKMDDLKKSKEIPTKPTQVNPPKKTVPNNKKEELSSTTTKNFSATKTPSPKQPPQKTEEERLQEFAKLIEKQKAETKKLTKRSWNVLNEKDSESFRVPKDFDIKSFHSLEESFNCLDINVKRFIYHLYQASWIGSFINATQSSTTKELFELLILIFTHYTVEELRDLACEKATQKVTKEEYEEFVNYSALVFLNLGNYHHQDRKKFIPNLSKTSFEKIVNAFSDKYPKAKSYYTACQSVIFDVTENNQKAGVKDSDAIPFYSGEISFEETILSEQDILNSEKFTSEGLLNSCLLKTNKIEEGRDVFELYTSAVEVKDVITVKPKDVNFVIKRKTGLFSGYLKIMSQHLFSSLSFIPGVSRQKDLLLRYINYFGEGSQSHFDVAQRLWQYEHNPQVEFHFAFVPTYKDPFKKRGEARSFVGLTTQTQLAQKVLSNAKKIVDQIPQSSNFAQYPLALPVLEFVDLISFVHSFVPSSISFPEVEFMTRPKTIVFTNTFDVKTSDTLYFSESQKKIFTENFTEASIIYTTLYQVFGYPFGKFFTKNKMGNFNFDVDMINPLTNEKIVGHYLPGEIFSVLFGENAELLESLKADAIALYLSLNETVLSVFNVTDTKKQQDISTSLLLSTAQSLLRSLSLYDENTKKWDNPKHHAKYILGNYLLEKQIFSFEENSSENSFSINFDFEKVSDVAKQSLEHLLHSLFVYRAVGNVDQTKVLFEKYSVVPQSLKTLSTKFFPLRNFSSLFVQPNIFFTASGDDNKPNVTFKSYPNTKEGLINSFSDRFK